MPRALSADRDLWGRTLSLLLIGFICYALPLSVFAALPASEGDQPVLRIQGSNTIGAKLGPELVKGLFEAQGLHDIRSENGSRENEQRLLARQSDGRLIVVEVAAHGSGTGFTSLKDGRADLAASSRPIKDGEAASLASLGDMHSPQSEQVIAIDGLAIIVHPSNPITALSVEQIAQLFSGEIDDWAALGGKPGKVRPYARDDNSGTYDTFKELVLAPGGRTLAADAQRFESSNQLSDSVSSDPNGIGFIGLPYIRQAKAVAVAAGDSQPMPPSTTLIATEDYPLARRLFIYNDPQLSNPWARALIEFTHSPRGQAIVDSSGFIAQTVQTVKVTADAQMPSDYRQLAQQAQRLSVNFRFQEGSASLDNKALRDVQRVAEYLRQAGKLQGKAVLVGFGDPKETPGRAALLSRLRAQAVRRELARGGVEVMQVTGMGDELPVAGNELEQGRLRNRRVEVWVY